jgi:hypothetical protein
MKEDTIMQEIREVRGQIAKECNYNFETICRYFENLEKEAIKSGLKFANPLKKSS